MPRQIHWVVVSRGTPGTQGIIMCKGHKRWTSLAAKYFWRVLASPVKFEILRFAPKMLPESADGLRKLKLTYILQSSAWVAHLLAYQRILQFILWRGFNFVLYKWHKHTLALKAMVAPSIDNPWGSYQRHERKTHSNNLIIRSPKARSRVS